MFLFRALTQSPFCLDIAGKAQMELITLRMVPRALGLAHLTRVQSKTVLLITLVFFGNDILKYLPLKQPVRKKYQNTA